MKILTILFTFILLLNCKEKEKTEEYNQYEKPISILFIKNKYHIKVIKNISLKPKIIGTISSKNENKIKILGDGYKTIQTIKEKTNKTIYYYKIACINSFRKCINNSAFIIKDNRLIDLYSFNHISTLFEENENLETEMFYYVLEKYSADNNDTKKNYAILLEKENEINYLKQTRDWLEKKIQQIPNELSFKMFYWHLLKTKSINRTFLKAMEIYLLNKAMKNPQEINKKLSKFISFKVLDDIINLYKKNPKNYLKNKYAKGLNFNSDKFKTFNTLFEKNIEGKVQSFPLLKDTWKKLSKEFNHLKNTPIIQEKVFQNTIKDTIYSVNNTKYSFIGNQNNIKKHIESINKETISKKDKKNNDKNFNEKEDNFISAVNWKITINPLRNPVIHYNLEGVKKSIEILSISSKPSKKGLSFIIKTKKNNIIIDPLTTSPFLSRGGPLIKEYLKKIPKKYKAIREYLKEADDSNRFRRYLNIVLTKGKGGYNSYSQKMIYELKARGLNYYYLYDMFRYSPHARCANERCHYGTRECNIQLHSNCKWTQPAGILRLRYMYDWGGAAADEKEFSKDFPCLSKSDESKPTSITECLEFTFEPNQLLAKNPKYTIQVLYAGDFGCIDEPPSKSEIIRKTNINIDELPGNDQFLETCEKALQVHIEPEYNEYERRN